MNTIIISLACLVTLDYSNIAKILDYIENEIFKNEFNSNYQITISNLYEEQVEIYDTSYISDKNNTYTFRQHENIDWEGKVIFFKLIHKKDNDKYAIEIKYINGIHSEDHYLIYFTLSSIGEIDVYGYHHGLSFRSHFPYPKETPSIDSMNKTNKK